MSARKTLSIRNKSDIWETHLINEEVFLYISQLEVYINNPEVTSFLYRYPDKFRKAIMRIENENKK